MKKGRSQKTTKKFPGIIRNYFDNLHPNKLENLEEKDKFIETH
jgi:hypothetical protein